MKSDLRRVARGFIPQKSLDFAIRLLAFAWAAVCSPPLLAADKPTVIAQGAVVEHEAQQSGPLERVRRASQEVYRIFVDVDGATKSGTAFLVNGKHIVATSYHVIDGGTAFSLGYIDAGGDAKRISLRVVAVYPQKDLALLEASEELPGQPLSLGKQTPLPGADLYAIGFPGAADHQTSPANNSEDETFLVPSVLKGTLSRVLTNRWLTSQLQHQTPIVPGYSGGPLLSSDGVVVGISSAIHKEANGISYGVLAGDLSEFLNASALPVDGKLMGHATTESSASPPAEDKTSAPSPPVVERPALTENDLVALNRAENLLHHRNVAAARTICQDLVKATQSPEALRCLGNTYDPDVLRELGATSLSGNANLAQYCYEQASKALHVPQRRRTLQQTTASLLPQQLSDVRVCQLTLRTNEPVITCAYPFKN